MVVVLVGRDVVWYGMVGSCFGGDGTGWQGTGLQTCTRHVYHFLFGAFFTLVWQGGCLRRSSSIAKRELGGWGTWVVTNVVYFEAPVVGVAAARYFLRESRLGNL